MGPWRRLAQLLLPEPHWVPRGAACPSAQSASSLLPGLLTVQVAAWDGCLLTLVSSDHQDQQAEEQGLGGRHGHLKHGGRQMSLDGCAGGRGVLSTLRASR